MFAELVEHRAHDLEPDGCARVAGVDGLAEPPGEPRPDVLTRQLELTGKRIEAALVALVHVREHPTQQPTRGERR
jgi:hypothetical protein